MKSILFLTIFITTTSCSNSLTKEENNELIKINSLLPSFGLLLDPKFSISGISSLETVQPTTLAKILMKHGNLVFKSKDVGAITREMDEDFLFKGCNGTLNRDQAVKNAMKNMKHRIREVTNGRLDGNIVIGEVDFVQKGDWAVKEVVYPMEYHWKHLGNGTFVLRLTKVIKCVGVEKDFIPEF